MTRERAKEMLPVLQAWAEGKTVQFEVAGRWVDCTDGTTFHSGKHRIKPIKPKLRPWKAEEVPVGAWIRTKGMTGYFTSIIGVCCGNEFMCAEHEVEEMFTSFDKAFKTHEHSLDKGKTWLPCGVEE